MLIFECTNTVTMASSVKGFDKLIKGLDAASRKFQTDVKEILEVNAGFIERDAIRDAPGPGDRIKTQSGSISQDSISDKRRGSLVPISQAIGYKISTDGYKATIYVDKSAGDIAVYTEVGTGQSAKTYLADKSPEWKAFAMRYYVNGRGTIIAQPYLLPAFMRYQIQVIRELKQAMKDIKI